MLERLARKDRWSWACSHLSSVHLPLRWTLQSNLHEELLWWLYEYAENPQCERNSIILLHSWERRGICMLRAAFFDYLLVVGISIDWNDKTHSPLDHFEYLVDAIYIYKIKVLWYWQSWRDIQEGLQISQRSRVYRWIVSSNQISQSYLFSIYVGTWYRMNANAAATTILWTLNAQFRLLLQISSSTAMIGFECWRYDDDWSARFSIHHMFQFRRSFRPPIYLRKLTIFYHFLSTFMSVCDCRSLSQLSPAGQACSSSGDTTRTDPPHSIDQWSF